MKINVTGQKVEVIEPDLLVSGAIDEYLVEFIFDFTWDDYVKTVVFLTSNNISYTAVLLDDVCVIPRDALKNDGYLKIGCYGVNVNKIKTTVFTPTQTIYKGTKI